MSSPPSLALGLRPRLAGVLAAAVELAAALAGAFLAAAGFFSVWAGASSPSAAFLRPRLGVAAASSSSAMALSSAWDLVTTSVSFFALAADAALFGPAAALAGAEEVVEVLGFAGASGACLDFTDFETGMKIGRAHV